MYILKTYDGLSLTLKEEEAQKVLEAINAGTQKSIVVQNNYFAISNISSLTKEEISEETDHTIGVLHDGSRVIRQFGQWFCLDGEVSENNHYSVRPDPYYYPEVAMDCVPSVKTYEQKYQALPPAERKQAICGGRDTKRYLGGTGVSSVADILAGKKTEQEKLDEPEWCIRHDCYIVDCSCFDQREEDEREKIDQTLEIAD